MRRNIMKKKCFIRKTTFKTARSFARSAPINLPSKFFWSLREIIESENNSYSTNIVLYTKKCCKSHPSDARILTRATTCPGLGFLERALPITETIEEQNG
jgi:hypothetical protein